jgi:adenylate kinase family enzyme
VKDLAQLPLGRRILVWGGGGKSTLARALGRKLEMPVIELDALSWLPDWVERDPQEFRALTFRTVEECGPAWIVDGQYTSLLGGELLARADTLVWLDLPWRVIFWRIVRRGIQRIWDKQRICGDNVETWYQMFLKRDSLMYWHLGRRLSGAHRLSVDKKQALIEANGHRATVVRLRTRRELREFYEAHGLVPL